jgi:outer membrane protein
MATQQQVKLAESQVEISKGAHYPSLDLIGNYYLTRTGILATSDWDLGLAVVIPLFQGGGVQAAVRESVQMKNVAVLDSSQTLRIAERDLAVNYQNYVQIHEQLNTLKLALEKAEEAYKLNRRDYQYGQVTNLDVLTSLNLFIETKRSYQNLYSLAHMAHKNLEASIGVLP